jgi:TonB family protein
MTQASQPIPGNELPPRRGDERNPQNTKLQRIGGLRPELLYGQYGFLENPFGVTSNPRYLYESRTHAEARSSLITGIECGVGFQALIAPPGMGKTTMLLSVLELFKDVARTAFLFQIQGDSRDYLRYLLLDLDCDAHDSDLVRMQDAINQLLIREHRAGRRTIIVIDEAQGLDVSVLETVRLLSNFETPSEKLMQIILAGTPQFAERLSDPRLAQLSQRLSILAKLVPFGWQDTINYIEHRLRIAGYQGPPLFTPEAVRLIWERSRGIPREINTLCFNALLLAIAVEQKQVDSEILREVVADLDLNPIPFNNDTPPRSIRDVPTADVLQLGDAAAVPPATRIDKTCEAAVPGAKAKADDASTSNGVDLVQLGTIVAETGPASRIERAEQTATRGTEAGADDVVVRAALPDRPALTSHPKTDVVTSAGPRVAGLPSWETKAAGNSTEVPHFTPEALEAPRANGAATRVHLKQFFLTNSVWIAAITALVMVGSSLVHQHTGSAHNARTPFRMPQQNRRTFNSTMDQIPTQSSGLITKIVSARLIHKVKPIYPPAAVEARIQGSVVLQALVAKDGAVRDVRLISGPPILAPAAIDAVKQWQYRPSYVNGQPFEWESLVTVNFTLR